MQILTFLAMALFMLVAVSILAGSHYLVYHSLAVFFQIISPGAKTALGSLFFLLGVSYIIASILAHWHETLFTRGYYFLSGLWLGVLSNLFWAFVFGWLALWLFRLFHIDINAMTIGILALAIGLAVSGYGAWNAYYNLRVKNITVKIKDLPAEWRGKTVVQLSDIHLGHVLRQAYLKKVVDMTNRAAPEAVFITGDLFDGMDGDLGTSLKPLDDLDAPKGAYFVTGNHETYFGVAKVFELLSKTKVKVLNDRMEIADGLQIVGAGYPERGAIKKLSETISRISGYDPSKPSILLYHSPTHIDEAKASGIDLQLSGHTHKGQIWPFNLVTRLVYKGYDYGLKEEGDFSIYTTNGTGVWGPTMRTGNTSEIVAIKLEAK